MLSENYVMINELMKSKWTSAQLKTSLTSFKKIINSTKRFELNHLKVHNYLLVKVCFVMLFNPYLFFYHVWYILQDILKWNNDERCIWMEKHILKHNRYFHFKKFTTICLMYIYWILLLWIYSYPNWNF